MRWLKLKRHFCSLALWFAHTKTRDREWGRERRKISISTLITTLDYGNIFCEPNYKILIKVISYLRVPNGWRSNYRLTHTLMVIFHSKNDCSEAVKTSHRFLYWKKQLHNWFSLLLLLVQICLREKSFHLHQKKTEQTNFDEATDWISFRLFTGNIFLCLNRNDSALKYCISLEA